MSKERATVTHLIQCCVGIIWSECGIEERYYLPNRNLIFFPNIRTVISNWAVSPCIVFFFQEVHKHHTENFLCSQNVYVFCLYTFIVVRSVLLFCLFCCIPRCLGWAVAFGTWVGGHESTWQISWTGCLLKEKVRNGALCPGLARLRAEFHIRVMPERLLLTTQEVGQRELCLCTKYNYQLCPITWTRQGPNTAMKQFTIKIKESNKCSQLTLY